MSIGRTIGRTGTKTGTKLHPPFGGFTPVPIFELPPFGPGGVGPLIPKTVSGGDGPGGGPGVPHGTGDGDPIPTGEDPPAEPDWDKIFDPEPDPLLQDPLEVWSVLFQGWAVHLAKVLVSITKQASDKQMIKYQAPWLGYVITTFPRYTLSATRLQSYLNEWLKISEIVSFGLKTPEAITAADVKTFEELKTVLGKLATQMHDLPQCKWTGFMTSGVTAHPTVGGDSGGDGGSKDTVKGGLKPWHPASSSGSDQSDGDDEDFNPGDSMDNRPDQEQLRQRQWEALFLAWRTDFITYLSAIRIATNANQMTQISLLIHQLRAGPPVGANQATINTTLTTWDLAAQLIRQLTDFATLPAANMDQRLNTILGPDLTFLRQRLAALVNAHPNYVWPGDN